METTIINTIIKNPTSFPDIALALIFYAVALKIAGVRALKISPMPLARNQKKTKLCAQLNGTNVMGKSNEHAIKRSGGIQCVEVLVSKNFAHNTQGGLRPLSVYSLENQPVKKSIRNSEVFHFMLYDWKRTIQKVLEENQVAYSVLRFFTTETVYGDHTEEHRGKVDVFSTGQEHHDVSYATELEEAG